MATIHNGLKEEQHSEGSEERSPFLEAVARLLQAEVAPQAEAMDEDPEALRSGLQALGQAGWLGLRLDNGGVDEMTFCQFQELIAQYSGALAFLQAQHQSAGALLNHSSNQALQAAYLPGMATGTTLMGIGFAHLRREPSPLNAIPVSGGYHLRGQAPWVTGYSHFQSFIVAARLPDGSSLYGLVPLQDTDQGVGGRLICSAPMSLCAVHSTQTVSVEFEHWYLPAAQVVAVRPAGAIHKHDQINVLSHSFFALGNARASLNIIQQTLQAKPAPFLQEAYLSLNSELNECRSSIYKAIHATAFTSKLRLRAWSIELAGRCAQAAVTVTSGSANVKHHPAQRVYREALLFMVSGQTTAVMESTLTRLLRREPENSP